MFAISHYDHWSFEMVRWRKNKLGVNQDSQVKGQGAKRNSQLANKMQEKTKVSCPAFELTDSLKVIFQLAPTTKRFS
jgi:hypothetical protein